MSNSIQPEAVSSNQTLDEEQFEAPAEPTPPPPAASLPPSYFEAMYQSSPDPWSFETSGYEAGKYAATVAALPRPHYRNAFEIGCSIGVLTQKLAERTEKLLSVDVSQLALQRAKVRCLALSNVRFELLRIPADFPDDIFDLIVLSEVGYYLGMEDLLLARQGILERLEPGGHLILVHWTPFVDEYPLTGDIVHETFLEKVGDGLKLLHSQREEHYRLDLFERS